MAKISLFVTEDLAERMRVSEPTFNWSRIFRDAAEKALEGDGTDPKPRLDCIEDRVEALEELTHETGPPNLPAAKPAPGA